MKRILKTAALVATCALLTVPAFARPGGGDGDGDGPPEASRQERQRPGFVERFGDKLDLSAEQVTAIEAIEAEKKAARQDARGSMRAIKQELRALWQQVPVDAQAIRDKSDELDALQDGKREERIEFRLALLGTLTPEQQEVLAAEKAQNPGKGMRSEARGKRRHRGMKGQGGGDCEHAGRN